MKAVCSLVAAVPILWTSDPLMTLKTRADPITDSALV